MDTVHYPLNPAPWLLNEPYGLEKWRQTKWSKFHFNKPVMSKIKLYSNLIMRAPPCIFVVSGKEYKAILNCEM